MNRPLSAAEAQAASDKLYRPSFSERLKTRLARLARWEFWPAWAFYPPIVAYIAWRALRSPYRLAFTAANPGIIASGVVGETKHEALEPLQCNAPEYVGRFERLGHADPIPDRMARVRAFVMEVGGFPVVCKPDIGQRGRGVAVIHTEEEARRYLDGAYDDVILQRYVSGAEFGVFVYRDPNTDKVELLSIVRKCFPKVAGDGVRTLAALIRDDERARLIAPGLWQRFAGRLHEVPTLDENIQLVEIGAHSRGSLFLDGNDLASEPLRQTMSRILDAVPGYNFGRIDLRCPSEAALREGSGIQVMEMNGVTAESAHIYHPGSSLFVAWRTMIHQWRLAFEIGEANARNGAPVTSAMALFRLWRADIERGKRWF